MSKKVKSIGLRYSKIQDQRTEHLQKSRKPMIGIDIGSCYVKIVQMKNNRVIRTGMGELPDGLVSQGRIADVMGLSKIIKTVIRRNKIKGGECSLCISGNEIIVRELKLPEMNEEQIMENIKHEIKSYLPIKQEEYCIDYKILSYKPPQEGKGARLRIMIVAAPQSLIQPYIEALKKVNLKTEYIDVMPNIAGKMAKYLSDGAAGNIGFIDFGANATNFILTRKGNYILHKSITNGGDALTAQVAQKFNVDILEAEDMKRKTDFFKSPDSQGDTQFVDNYLNYLIMDMERTIDFFKSRNNQEGIDRIYITGGGSLLMGVTEYLKNHFKLDIRPLEDTLQSYSRKKDNSSRLAFFAQAIGTTLREG